MLLIIKVKCLTALISPESSLFLTLPKTTEWETRLAKPYIQTICTLTDFAVVLHILFDILAIYLLFLSLINCICAIRLLQAKSL